MTDALPSRLRPNPSVIETDVPNGDIVLVNLDTRRSYSLNPTGSLVWLLVRQGLEPAAIATVVASTFDVREPVATQDVRRLLGELLAEGLLDDGDA